MPPTNYIYIDYENVQACDLNLIAGRPAKVILVVGPNSHKLPTELIDRALQLQGQLELVRLGQAGKNALDCVLAFELGQRVFTDSQGFFHIVFKDKGFDALVGHLKAKKIHATRYDAFTDIKFLTELTLAERVARVREFLEKALPVARPGNRNCVPISLRGSASRFPKPRSIKPLPPSRKPKFSPSTTRAKLPIPRANPRSVRNKKQALLPYCPD